MSATAPRLLIEADPAPVRLLRPEGRSDFLLTGDHAGRAIVELAAVVGSTVSSNKTTT